MKKILALLLALALCLSMTPVFAEETGTEGETTEEVTYATLAEKYAAEVGNLTRIKEGWKVVGGEVSPSSGNSAKAIASSGLFQIVKVDIPKIENGHKLDKLVVRFVHNAGDDNFVALKVDNIDVPNVENIADTDFYKAVTKSQNPTAYKAFESNEAEAAFGSKFYYVDITKYAQDCYYAGKDFVYLAIGSWNSTVDSYVPACSDSDYVAAGYPPHYYYSIKDVETPAKMDASIEGYTSLENESLVLTSYFCDTGAVSVVTGNKKDGTYLSGRAD